MKYLAVMLFLAISTKAVSYSATNLVAWTLAESVYTVGLTAATGELTGNLTSISTRQKAEARLVQIDAEEYYFSETLTPFLKDKVEMAKNLFPDLSTSEAVDQLVESAKIILN